MKKRNLICAVMLVAISSCVPALCQPGGSADAPYKLTIQALEPVDSRLVASGEPEIMSGYGVALKVTLTNLSGHKLVCCSGSGWDYQFYVRDGAGHLLKGMEYTPTGHSGGPSDTTLDPGQTWTGDLALNSNAGTPGAFDLTRPGTYSVQLGWPANPGPGEEEEVKSNIVKFTITEPRPFELIIGGYADGRPGGLHFIAKAGKTIGINIEKRNISKGEIDCSSANNVFTGLDDKYQYDIRDSNGDPVPARSIPLPRSPYIAGDRTEPCKPGESAGSGSVNLTKVYDLSRPGVYTVRVSQPVSENPLDGEVKSNKITVTVVP